MPFDSAVLNLEPCVLNVGSAWFSMLTINVKLFTLKLTKCEKIIFRRITSKGTMVIYFQVPYLSDPFLSAVQSTLCRLKPQVY